MVSSQRNLLGLKLGSKFVYDDGFEDVFYLNGIIIFIGQSESGKS